MMRILSLVGAALVLTGAAPAAMFLLDESSDPAAPAAEGHAHDEGAHAHAYPVSWSAAQQEALKSRAGTGKVPTLQEALGLKRVSVIDIRGDLGFTPANGVLQGRGTLDDPFVLEGLYVDVLSLSDTDAVFELRNSYVADTLILDWTNLGGFVHHNHIGDLRVNRNVDRVGMPTAAVISDNEIGQIGQLRHFDGVLARNVIGDPVKPAFGSRVFLLDGFNGAAIVDNTVYGYTEMKLHGHHHSSAHGMSHNHAMEDSEDHGERYHSLLVSGNRFVDPLGKGLRVHDRDHAGDDRTATSEENPALEAPHTHWTRIDLLGNRFEGAGLFVDVFNAPDDYHVSPYRGTLLIEKNRFANLTDAAIRLGDIAMGDVTVRGNVGATGLIPVGHIAGIDAYRFGNATLTLDDNRFEGVYYGVKARQFEARTTWSVERLSAPGAAYPVYWDETVVNRPGDPPAGTEQEAGHDHEAHSPSGSRRGSATTAPALPLRL